MNQSNATATRPENSGGAEKPIRQYRLAIVLGSCSVAVAVLFFAYELVERTWLAGVDPSALHTLHIVRGVCAATMAAVLASFVLIKLEDSSTSEAARSPAPTSWKHRFQNVRLRTKIVVPMLALAAIPTIGAGIFTVSHAQTALKTSALQAIRFRTAAKAQAIGAFLATVRKDVLYLSRVDSIRNLVSTSATPLATSNEPLLAKATHDWLLLAQGKGAYDQVRYIDAAGREILRLNMVAGTPSVVERSQLQDKSSRYYVQAALALEPGSVYVSPIDLNIEHGRVQEPQRSVVRFATRVPDSLGKGTGAVVINLNANYILSSLIGPLPTNTSAALVNQQGAYVGLVGAPNQQRSANRSQPRHLFQDYPRAVAEAVVALGSLSDTHETDSAFLSYATIAGSFGNAAEHWTLLMTQPRGPIEQPIRYLIVFLCVVTMLLTTVAGMVGILVAHYLARPVAHLRRATREIAAGRLSAHVQVATGDEIGELAHDFNTMTDRLREAQERLSSWNAKLEEEVAEQTASLRHLQAGLARTDKMASVGQMTASVMHEVGNPLAAMKTRIQLAQEECAIVDKEGLTVMADVLAEINRLSAFLHSFSRLSRLRKPVFCNVEVSEVIDGVVTLIGAVFKKHRIALQVRISQHVPPVRGDADQLRHLLINLLLNASEASNAGDTVVISAYGRGEPGGCSSPEPGVVIEVSDSGAGIPEHILHKAGQPFFTTKPTGTGLGLAICRTIVRDHNATMELQSTLGAGTKVTVVIPCTLGSQRPQLETEAAESCVPEGTT